jgi:hypothetical protein
VTRSPDDLSRLQASLARLEGRRDAMIERARALTAAVELAKGRLAVRPEVEAFIEGVHEDASRRSLVNLETLLTALVQEVLPGEKPVRLDLATERGLASLNICVARPDGALEDVLEDNGGALTNVVGTALRLVAVVKAGVGRFLALDEADCWIAPERVPAFYRVMVDGAARLGVQCLAVSHHDLSALSDEVHVSRVEGRPEEGVRIVADGSEPTWDEGRAGLRFVRLVDVQAYRDATLRLSPGVNALVGPNNRGKSTFIRALRAVFYGEARDSLVRAGARSALVEIGVAGGRTLRFTRRPGRSPVNVWSLHDADGSVVEEGGLRHETGGRAVPPWVEDLVRINRVEVSTSTSRTRSSPSSSWASPRRAARRCSPSARRPLTSATCWRCTGSAAPRTRRSCARGSGNSRRSRAPSRASTPWSPCGHASPRLRRSPPT